MKGLFNKRQGFTLMELLVAMAVFLIVVGLSSGIFIQTLKSQRTIARISEAMNNSTLAMEQIAREVRTGFDFRFSGDLDQLEFRNGFGDYVTYTLVEENEGEGGVIGRCTSFQSGVCNVEPDFNPITSPDVVIRDLRFLVQQEAGQKPTLVTISADIEIDRGSVLTMQTSVSSRILENPLSP